MEESHGAHTWRLGAGWRVPAAASHNWFSRPPPARPWGRRRAAFWTPLDIETARGYCIYLLTLLLYRKIYTLQSARASVAGERAGGVRRRAGARRMHVDYTVRNTWSWTNGTSRKSK